MELTQRLKIAFTFGTAAFCASAAFFLLFGGSDADGMVAMSVLAAVSACFVAALQAPLYLRSTVPSAIGVGALCAVLSHAVLALMMLFAPGGMDVESPLVSVMLAGQIFVTSLLFVGWITIPVGGVTGFIVHRAWGANENRE